MLKHVKLVLVLFSLVFVYFFITINSTYEVETIVQSKFDGLDCLRKYGGEISNLEYGSNNDVGGKVTMDIKEAFATEYSWTGESRIIDVGVYSKSWQNLKAINYRIYTKYGDLCTGNLDNVDTSKESAEFRVTFNSSVWVYFEVTGVDTSKSGNIGKEDRQVKVDKESPELVDVKAEIGEDRKLKILATVRDYYSGVDSMTIDVTTPSGSMINVTDGSYDGSDEFTKVYYRNVDLNDKGEGEYKVVVYANDKVLNTSETREITFSTVDANGNKVTGNVNLNQKVTSDSITDEEYQQQKEEAKEQNSGNGIPKKTNINGIGIGDSQKIKCDDSLKSFISEIWKYFVIFGPILLIVMVSLDFFKALFSSDSDMLTKAGSNTVKRTISAIILLLLPLIIETILGFFGLELCI